MCDGSLLLVAAKAPSPDQALWPHIIVSKLNQRCLPPLPHLCAYLVVVVESSLATTEGFLASENKKTHYIPIGVSICPRVPLLSPGKKLPCWCTQETVAQRYPSKSGSLIFNLSSTPAISGSSVLKVFLLSLLFLLCVRLCVTAYRGDHRTRKYFAHYPERVVKNKSYQNHGAPSIHWSYISQPTISTTRESCFDFVPT